MYVVKARPNSAITRIYTGEYMPAKQYGASSIRVLEGLEAVRTRPGMYIGSVSTRGLNHLIY